MKYKLWNRQDALITPSGHVFTPEQIATQYPAVNVPTTQWVICDSVTSMGVFMELTATLEHYQNLGVPITDAMTPQEALNAISAWEKNPPKAGPSAEERMAAAMEFANILNMPEVIV